MKITDDIIMLDAEYIRHDTACVYVIIQEDNVAIIETGTSYTIPIIEKMLHDYQLSFDHVRYIIPTHVHLDHAGGAGALMQQCRHARLIIHPKGARHMVDPSRLIAGTKEVYGEQKFKEYYGDIIPIECDRIIIAEDQFECYLGTKLLKFIDTPGHANHHFCVWDAQNKVMFTGDSFGVSYPEFQQDHHIFIFPTTTPVQFNPEKLVQTFDNIMSYQPDVVCLTHFGACKPSVPMVETLKKHVKDFCAMAEHEYHLPNAQHIIEQKMMAYLLQELEQHDYHDMGKAQSLLQNDVTLNTQGLIVYYQRLHQLS